MLLEKNVAWTIAISTNVAISKVAVPKVSQTSIPGYCCYHQILLVQRLLENVFRQILLQKESVEQLPLQQMLQFQKSQFQR